MKKTLLLSYLLITSSFTSASLAEFQVNAHTSNKQEGAAVAMDANGSFVVVWKSYLHPQDGSSWGILGQRFNQNCEPQGDEFRINTTTSGNQKEPSVAMNSMGNFVVAWQSLEVNDANEEDIFAQRFDVNGQPLSGQFLVNSYTDSRQQAPSVAMNDDGCFVIVWESMNLPEEPNKKSICGQLYSSSGLAVGGEFVVNHELSICRYPDVSMRDNGEFTVVWTKESTLKSVWVRHFEADGNAPYLGKKVNDDFNFTSLTRPSVAVDGVGNYAVVWDGHPSDYLEDDIYLKRYHWSHAPLHGQFLVNTYQAGAQANPSVAMSDDGRFVVIWDSETVTEDKDIFGQRFPSQGEHIGEPILIGEQFRINTYTPDNQEQPAVAMKENGRFVTAWQSYGQDGSNYGIFGQMAMIVESADFNGDGFVNFSDFCILAQDWLESEPPLPADLTNDNKIDRKDLDAFTSYWLTARYDCNEVDINSDGKINLKDYALWAVNWLNYGPYLDGDIDGDWNVDMKDLRAIVFHWAQTCD